MLASPFRAFFKLVFGFLSGGDSELGQQIPVSRRIWRAFVRLLFLPFWLTFQILKFIILSWTTTRDGNTAMLGALPLAGIMAVLAILVVSGLLQNRRILGLHNSSAKDCVEVKDYENAVLYSRRVQNITGMESLRFNHAMVIEQAGMEQNAIAIAREMADPNTAGFLPAHVYLAQKLVAVTEDDPAHNDNMKMARQHLERVIDKASHVGDPSYVTAARLLPQVIFQLGEVESAMRLFEQISALEPRVVPELAKYMIENGRESEADVHIERGISRIKEFAQINPNVRELWLWMYQILMVRKDYNLAIHELGLGLRQTTNNTIRAFILRLQSDVRIELSNAFGDDISTADNYRRKLIPVCQAVQGCPQNPLAIAAFIDLVVFPSNENATVWLEDEARDHASPSMYHIINGVRDSVFGKPATGGQHFRLAFNGDSRVAIIVNEIAVSMYRDKKRYRDALKLVDVAIATWGGVARLFHTRGNILMELGRHQEALADLEYAFEHIKKDPGLMESLATAIAESGGKTGESESLLEQARLLREEIEQKQKEYFRQLATGERS